ncbi:MAG: heavy-metal-associated domain-containing protein [Clostridia bacterium]|nr:heavy-metal-associated domain-containing protein [Clostridia bacterium]
MKYQWTLTGLACPNCAAKLSDLLEKEEGIASAKINFLAETLTVESSLSEEQTKELCLRVGKAFEKDVEID